MNRSCKVFPLLLAIAYLEVVIWITVLCTSAVAVNINAEDTAYVYSQTENLKHSVISSTSCGHFGEQPLDTALERADLLYQHRIEAEQLSLLAHLRTQQQLPTGPQLNDLYLHLSTELSGIPAPYTGVHAIF